MCWKLSNINSSEINADNGRLFGFYDLDHIVPISYGYRNNIPIHLIASRENLRIIPHKENFAKGAKPYGRINRDTKWVA